MALGRNAKGGLIRQVPLFSRCTRKELAEVASIADEVDLPTERVLMREGERGLEFFVLLHGTAEVHRNGRRINTLGDGDFFGEIALVSRSVRTATVTTTTPARVLVIREQAFRALLVHAPQIQIRVLEALADRLAPSTL